MRDCELVEGILRFDCLPMGTERRQWNYSRQNHCRQLLRRLECGTRDYLRAFARELAKSRSNSPNLRSFCIFLERTARRTLPEPGHEHQHKHNSTQACRPPVSCMHLAQSRSPHAAADPFPLRFSLFVSGLRIVVKGQCGFTLPQICWPRSSVQPPPMTW